MNDKITKLAILLNEILAENTARIQESNDSIRTMANTIVRNVSTLDSGFNTRLQVMELEIKKMQTQLDQLVASLKIVGELLKDGKLKN